MEIKDSILERSYSDVPLLVGRLKEAKKRLASVRDRASSIREQLTHLEKVNELSSLVSDYVSRVGLSSVEGMISKALTDILGEQYAAKLDVSTGSTGKFGVKVLIQGPGGAFGEPKDAFGGAVVSIVSLVLRIVALNALRGSTEPVLILDEPTSFLNPKLFPSLESFLEYVSESLDMQVIMTTHVECTSGTVYEVSKQEGFSVVTKIS